MQGGRFYKHGAKFLVTQRKAAGGIKQSSNVHSLMNIIKKQGDMIDQIKELKEQEKIIRGGARQWDDGYGVTSNIR